jgi:hypothetical protein
MNTFGVKINIKDKNVKITEYSVRDLKFILKNLLLCESAPSDFIDNINSFVANKTDLQLERVESLNFLDFICLLIQIKCLSSPNIVDLIATVNDKQTNIQANLLFFAETIDKLNFKELQTAYITKDITINFKIPVLKDIFCLPPTYLPCSVIESVIIGDHRKIDYNKISYEKKIEVFNKLPIKAALGVRERFNAVKKKLEPVNLLEYLKIDKRVKIPINITPEYIISLFKIIFSEDITAIYENIFMLSKHSNISADYIENCTPGEYNIFMKQLEKTFVTEKVNEANEASIMQL